MPLSTLSDSIKKCTKCGVEKPVEEFHKASTRKDGLQCWCKGCKSGHYQENQEELLEYAAQYRDEHKEEVIESKARHYQENKEKVSAKIKKYAQEHIEEKAEYDKQYNSNSEVKTRRNCRNKERRKIDPKFQFKEFCLWQAKKVLKGNSKLYGHEEYLGCTKEEGINHIESLWDEGMTWENHGSGPGMWEIHHILQLHTFDTDDPEAVFKACHYTNLVPLWYDEHKKIHGHTNITR